MPDQCEPSPPALTKAELRARVIGTSLERDQEDVEFWKHASEAMRGETLYRLRLRGKRLRASVPRLQRFEENPQRLRLTVRAGASGALER
ncbi:MAG TPA: hypothetical protein VFD32_22380 [Dehalococcoidia bacterium]|nr:hypothetical protein [Dehalococcoidia bacterium]